MESKKDEISLGELYAQFWSGLSYLLNQKWRIIIVALIMGGAGLVYAFLSPVNYSSKLSFIVEQSSNTGRLNALSGIASNFGIGGWSNNGGLYDNQANLMSYLKSRSVIEESLLAPIPETDQCFANEFARVYGWKEQWENDAGLAGIDFNNKTDRSQFTRQEDSVLFEMYNYILEEELLGVSVPNEDGSIIEVHLKSKSPDFSRFFPETLLDIVANNYSTAKTSQARENVKILQHQTDSVRKELNEAMMGSASATEDIFGLNPAYTVERVPAGKKEIDIKVSGAILEELVKNLEMAKVRLMDQTPLIEVIDRPQFPLKQIKKGKISTTIKFSLISAFVYILILLVGRSIGKLHKNVVNE